MSTRRKALPFQTDGWREKRKGVAGKNGLPRRKAHGSAGNEKRVDKGCRRREARNSQENRGEKGKKKNGSGRERAGLGADTFLYCEVNIA